MLDLAIDRSRPTPLSEQVQRQVQALIEGGVLPGGRRLPSSRRLASDLGVSRNTVVQAYERLLEDGWVQAGVGRGTFVAGTGSDGAPPNGAGAPGAPPADGFGWSRAIVQDPPPPVHRAVPVDDGLRPSATIDLGGAVPGPDTYPAARIRRVIDQVLAREGARALGYGPPAGYRPLRAFIAERSSRHGVAVGAEDVLIVGGSQQGLDLIGRLLLRAGDRVAVEAPTYSNALQLWRLHGARVIGVPMDGHGIDPEALQATLARESPKLLYLMPSFQNPTGLTMDEARRRAVMAVVRAARVAVVEDHFDTELRYGGRQQPPLRALDPDGQVVLVGTFSKMLCPGFRLGWVIAPPALRRRLLEVKQVCDLTTSLPTQIAVAELCRRGELDRHLIRVNAAHARRLGVMLAAIERHLPSTVAVTRPSGGMTLWLTLPPPADALAVWQLAGARGVAVAPGPWFYPDPGVPEARRHLRLSFVGESAARIEQGIAALGEALAEHLRTRTPLVHHEETTPFV